MRYVITVHTAEQDFETVLEFLEFRTMTDAQIFCRKGNARERGRSSMRYGVRQIVDTERGRR